MSSFHVFATVFQALSPHCRKMADNYSNPEVEIVYVELKDYETSGIDHVITSVRIWQALCNAVSESQKKTVLVSCDVETLRRREAERGDRCAGSAEASLQYLYPKTGYDLCVDSSNKSPAALAEEIMKELWQTQ